MPPLLHLPSLVHAQQCSHLYQTQAAAPSNRIPRLNQIWNDDRNLQRKPKISSASVGFHFVGGIQMFLNYKGANTSVSYNIPSLEISN
ncbi:hypothetical protein MRB53_011811 [Persea americana]|uniref:Uncharacterized protein n=1 Tax=Persea americana TaxID=3435 RepID=A0ACC2LWZ7_PERAE|nr:hypothetical protein MRB53_011811 [Persea americana]